MPTLETLSMDELTHLEGLPALTRLTSLALTYNSGVGDYDLTAAKAKALRGLTSLKTLKIEQLNYGEDEGDEHVHRKPVQLLLDCAPKSLETLELVALALAESHGCHGMVFERDVLMQLRQRSLVSMEVDCLSSDPPRLLEQVRPEEPAGSAQEHEAGRRELQVLASRAAPNGHLPLLRYRMEDERGGITTEGVARRWRGALARCDRVEDANGRPLLVKLQKGDKGEGGEEEERREAESDVDDKMSDQLVVKAEKGTDAKAEGVKAEGLEEGTAQTPKPADGLQEPGPTAVPQPSASPAGPLLPLIKPDPEVEGLSELGPLGPIMGPLLSPDQPPVIIKDEPGTTPGEARFSHVWSLPYDAAELAALRRRYLEPRVVTVEISSATRSGAIRMSSKQRKCRPAAEQSYERLWPHLQSLSEHMDEEAAAAAGAGGTPAAETGSATGAPSALAAALLSALRILRAYEAACGLDAAPRDAALSRVLPAYGAEVTTARAAAADVTSAEMLDLTAEEIDVEAYVLQQWPAEVVARVAVKREAA